MENPISYTNQNILGKNMFEESEGLNVPVKKTCPRLEGRDHRKNKGCCQVGYVF